MKNLILLATLSLLVHTSYAAIITATATNAAWDVNSSWDLNRRPQENDIVIIPVGKTITINNNLSFNRIYVKVYGLLKLSGSKISVSNDSYIAVYAGGKIKGSGSPSEQIRVNSNKIWQGNDADIIGPETANASTGGFVAFSILPVKFISFTASRTANDVLIQWSTSEEVNADHYELQRSYDGVNWNTIATIVATGNSNTTKNYSSTDKNNTAKQVYYRVKQVDATSMVIYTNVVSLKNETVNASNIKIASTQSNIVLQFPTQIKGSVVVRIISLNGQVLDNKNINQAVGQVVLNTNFKGNYIVSVSNGQEVNVAKQIIL